MKNIGKFFVIFLLIFATQTSFAQRGCCSWHGGVAGCDGSSGRQICRDGTYSPSCLCPLNASAAQASNTNVSSANTPQNQPITTVYQAENNVASSNPNPFPTGLYCSSLQECEKLAVNGDINAQTVLGIVYEKGQGVKTDYNKSIEWYNLAKNNSKMKEEPKEFSAWVNIQLALLYWQTGRNDIATDQAQIAALQGSTRAISLLGMISFSEEDYPQAFAFYEKAAEAGNPFAQLMLATMYTKGQGTLQDDIKAYAWVAVAIANGLSQSDEANAISLRGSLTLELQYHGLDQAKALAEEFYVKYKRKPYGLDY